MKFGAVPIGVLMVCGAICATEVNDRSLSLSLWKLSNEGVAKDGDVCNVVVRDVCGEFNQQGLKNHRGDQTEEFSPGYAVVIVNNNSDTPIDIPDWQFPGWRVRQGNGTPCYKSVGHISSYGLETVYYRVDPHSRLAFVIGGRHVEWKTIQKTYVELSYDMVSANEGRSRTNQLCRQPHRQASGEHSSDVAIKLDLVRQVNECYVTQMIGLKAIGQGTGISTNQPRTRFSGVRADYIVQVTNLSSGQLSLKSFDQGVWTILEKDNDGQFRERRVKPCGGEALARGTPALLAFHAGEIKTFAIGLEDCMQSNSCQCISLRYADNGIVVSSPFVEKTTSKVKRSRDSPR